MARLGRVHPVWRVAIGRATHLRGLSSADGLAQQSQLWTAQGGGSLRVLRCTAEGERRSLRGVRRSGQRPPPRATVEAVTALLCLAALLCAAPCAWRRLRAWRSRRAAAAAEAAFAATCARVPWRVAAVLDGGPLVLLAGDDALRAWWVVEGRAKYPGLAAMERRTEERR